MRAKNIYVIIAVAMSIFYTCDSKEKINTQIINSYGVVVKDSVNVYSDSNLGNISGNLKLSDIVFVKSKEKNFYKLSNKGEYVMDSCLVLIDSVLYQINIGSFVYANTYHDIFRIKNNEYTPIYISIYYPFLSRYDYQVKKHFAQDIKYIFEDKIPIDSSLFLKTKNESNIACLNSIKNEYQFFVIKDSTSGRIGIAIFWGLDRNTKSFIHGKGSKKFIENNFTNVKRSYSKMKLVGTWICRTNKWIFKEDRELNIVGENTNLEYTWTLNTNYTPNHLDLKIEGEPYILKAIVNFKQDDVMEIAYDKNLNRNVRPRNFSDTDARIETFNKDTGNTEDISISYVPQDDILKNMLYQSYKSNGVLNVEVNDFYVILEVNESLCRGFLLDKISTLTIMQNIIDTIKKVTNKNLGIVDIYYRNNKILTAETKIWDNGIKIKYFE